MRAESSGAIAYGSVVRESGAEEPVLWAQPETNAVNAARKTREQRDLRKLLITGVDVDCPINNLQFKPNAEPVDFI